MAQLFEDCGLTHFTYKSDREASIRAMLSEAVKLAGVNGTLDEEGDHDNTEAEEREAGDEAAPLPKQS